MTIEQIAKVCHEANRSFCQTIGDETQLAWESAAEWQKASARSGVVFWLKNPSISHTEMHDKWWREKQMNGWSWGPVKDVKKKEHPCCVPYHQLPREQQTKDVLFVSIAQALEPLWDGIIPEGL